MNIPVIEKLETIKPSADYMLEKLGYEKEYETDDEIVYCKYYDKENDCKAKIIFDKYVNAVGSEFYQPSGKLEAYYTNSKELKAIYKKCEELKWI